MDTYSTSTLGLPVETLTTPAVVRKDFRNAKSFTAAEVVKHLQKKYGVRMARGVVGTALWRMSLRGELSVTNSTPRTKWSTTSDWSYWTNKKHRIYTWNR